MTLFSNIDRAGQVAQERVYGEPFTLKPRKKSNDVNAGLIADPDRSERIVMGIYTSKNAPAHYINAYDPRADQRPGVSADRDTIEIDGRIGIIVKSGDILIRLADASRWSVENANPDDQGRLLCAVNRI